MRIVFIFLLACTFTNAASGQDSLYREAQQKYASGEFSSAYELYREAGLAYQLDDQFDQYALCNFFMAKCLREKGDIYASISLAESTNNYIEEVLQQKNLYADLLIFLGDGYLKIGRNDLALDALLKAEQNLEAKDDLKASECYNYLGVLYWNTENKETALNYLERSLAIRKEILPDDNELLADSYLNIGLIYLDDEYLQAIIHFDRALSIYKPLYGTSHPKVALCYSNISHAYRMLGNFQEALDYLDLTMEIWNSTYPGDHPSKAFVLSSKGSVLEEQEQYDRALLMQQEALQQYLRIHGTKHPEVANTYARIASVQFKQEDYKTAVESYQKSVYANLFNQESSSIFDLPEIRDYFNADILLSSLERKARALETLHFRKTLNPKHLKSAFETYKKCDELISDIRQLRVSEADKIKIGKMAADIYDNGIRIALYLADKTFQKPYYLKEAFGFNERSKSGVLRDAINDTKARHFAGIPDSLLTLEDSLKSQIILLEQQLAAGDLGMESIKSTLFDYKQSYRTFISTLEQDYPAYFRLKYEESDFTIEELQERIGRSMAILSYFIGSKSIYIFYVSKSGLRAYEVPKADNLHQLVSGFRNGIKYHIAEALESSSYQLYQQLIPKIEKDIRNLIIIPDGILGTVPFEALLMEDPKVGTESKYLLTDYAISYDFSSALFYEKNQATYSSNASGIMLSAPVAFQSNESSLMDLPGTEKEVNEIKYLFLAAPDKPSVFLKQRASERAIKSNELKAYRYLHFATHGVVNESKPALSRVFLAPDDQEDGSLYTGEIYNLEINANLVTLSACETGLGKVEKGEGIIGLSRALTYAGAKNLIVSLWQVADESTAQLMIEFYRQHLLHSESQIFSDDLRKAKLSLVNSENYSDPYYWAPFILIGK